MVYTPMQMVEGEYGNEKLRSRPKVEPPILAGEFTGSLKGVLRESTKGVLSHLYQSQPHPIQRAILYEDDANSTQVIGVEP